jgi:hypothetical protein
MLPARSVTRRCWLPVVFFLVVVFSTPPWHTVGAAEWYRGNTHAHSKWSDGNVTADVATAWYKNHGYNFLVLSDHNVLRTDALPALGATCNEPGEFLVVWGEEITTSYGGKAVHMNGLNLAAAITPIVGTSVADTVNKNVAQVVTQAATYGQPMISHINHPNWPSYSITPEEMAQAADTRFIEVLNCYASASSSAHFYGDATHPGMEKAWDIASTIRMENMGMLPMCGIASDDAHNYTTFSANYANPGRGWVVVRSQELSANAIMDAMNDGQFYFSTGVELETLEFNGITGTLSVAVVPKAGVTYTIEFIGTPEGTDPTKQGDGSYSADIGKVLSTVSGTSASYTLTGDELYVRVHVRSSKTMDNPPRDSIQYEGAWTQPVGAWLMVPGDANGDAAVDEDDAAILATNWGATSMNWSDGDFDSDGTVGAADASILAANWGHGVTEAASVPEPAASILLGGLVVLCLSRRRPWHRR